MYSGVMSSSRIRRSESADSSFINSGVLRTNQSFDNITMGVKLKIWVGELEAVLPSTSSSISPSKYL